MDVEHMSPFLKIVTNKYAATELTLILAYLLTKVGYAEIWPLFGSANLQFLNKCWNKGA
ncbi:carbon starvation CstA 5TM domain-containing protein [Ruminococcus sp. OA3]|uniref:carbon starvation CstA 5TM domain-containing protein n=1 Tax=Ruminococcus sp. OA3 TaxID=2914164 RepID=UPI0031F5186F